MLTNLSILLFTLCWMADNARPGPTQIPCSYYYNKTLKKNVYTQVEIVPEFPGGEAAYQRFLNRNLRYPNDMFAADTWQSSVVFTFIVDTDGQIKHPTFRGNQDTINFTPLEKEVNRTIKLMPQWVPGRCQGKMVVVEVKRSMVVCPERE